jgi:hypothetical protein
MRETAPQGQLVDAQGGGADERGDVDADADAVLLQLFEELVERRPGTSNFRSP